jgi:hypothetical protein
MHLVVCAHCTWCFGTWGIYIYTLPYALRFGLVSFRLVLVAGCLTPLSFHTISASIGTSWFFIEGSRHILFFLLGLLLLARAAVYMASGAFHLEVGRGWLRVCVGCLWERLWLGWVGIDWHAALGWRGVFLIHILIYLPIIRCLAGAVWTDVHSKRRWDE